MLYQAEPILTAAKANPWLVCEAAECADMIETCSCGEVEICRRNLGGKLSNVLYGGVAKDNSDITYAIESGINRFSIESVQQLKILNKCAKRLGVITDVLLRITSGNQFGMNVSEILDLFRQGMISEMTNISFIGVHYFSGTQRLDVKSVERDFIELQKLLDELSEIDIKEIEYGGGIGVDYFGGKDNTEVWNSVINNINKLSERYKVTYESGRALAAECGRYITKVVETKQRSDKVYVICDGGKHQIEYYTGLFAKMKKPPLECYNAVPSEIMRNTIICGSLCTIGDVLSNESVLPEFRPNDFVVFNKAGAYTVTENIALFLSRDLPSIYYVKNGNVSIARSKIGASKLNSK